MATVEQIGRFVIEPRADALLGQLSNDFSDILLKVASDITPTHTAQGLPVITVCSIAEASKLLCSVLDKTMKSGELSPEAGRVIASLKQFCDTAAKECANDAEKAQSPARPSAAH